MFIFLSHIGISLRKVEKGQQQQGEKGRMDGLHDVASILARRVAMEISDSESGSESGSGSDWDDETRYHLQTYLKVIEQLSDGKLFFFPWGLVEHSA